MLIGSDIVICVGHQPNVVLSILHHCMSVYIKLLRFMLLGKCGSDEVIYLFINPLT